MSVLGTDLEAHPDRATCQRRIETEQFFAPRRPRTEPPTAGFMYSPTRFKGCVVTIDALRRLRQRLPKDGPPSAEQVE